MQGFADSPCDTSSTQLLAQASTGSSGSTEEVCSPPSTWAGAVVPEVYVAMVRSVVM